MRLPPQVVTLITTDEDGRVVRALRSVEGITVDAVHPDALAERRAEGDLVVLDLDRLAAGAVLPILRAVHGADVHAVCLALTEQEAPALPTGPALDDLVVGVLRPPWTPARLARTLRHAGHVRALREDMARPAALDQQRVLLIEDDEADAFYMTELLEPHGAQVDHVRTLAEATQRVESHEYDVMLCDLALPDARGFDVVETLQRARPMVAKVVVSGLQDEAVCQELLRIGAQAFVSKDALDEAKLVREIRRAVQHAAGERRVQFEATHDPLTQLPNRRALTEALQRRLSRTGPAASEFAVLVLDLDGFKRINDTLGHAVGDEVLQAIARRFSRALKGQDLVARLGGDEFAVVMQADRRTAGVVAGRLVAAAARPIATSGGLARVGASVGGVMHAGPGATPTALLTRADAAMYRAKARGGGQVCFGAPGGPPEDGVAVAIAVPDDVDVALQGEYAPRDGALLGWEALLRAADTVSLSPRDLVAVLGRAGQLSAVRSNTLDRAWALVEAMPAAATLSLNLSEAEFQDDALLSSLQWCIERLGIPRGRLLVEVSEATLAADLAFSAARTHALVAMGVGVTIDDFGTGPLPLSCLRDLALRRLKVAPTILRDEPLLHAVAAMAGALGLELFGKGVETRAQLGVLRRVGAHGAQGWLLGRPADRARVHAGVETHGTEGDDHA